MSCTNLLRGREDADALYSFISGQHVLNKAVAVRITWEDSHTQTIAVKENIYFAMREGKFRYLRLDWLDKEGKVFESEENIQGSCGVISLP